MSKYPLAEIVNGQQEEIARLREQSDELLAALEGLVKHTEPWTHGPDIMHARLVIAKCRGEM